MSDGTKRTIRLTGIEMDSVYVVVDKITHYECNKYSARKLTKIYLTSGEVLEVQESPSEITEGVSGA